MYCIKCGAHLADSEKKCPLCETVVYHPDLVREDVPPLYPKGKAPKRASARTYLCGAVAILLFIPLIVTFLSDFLTDGRLDWFGYVGGGLIISYLIFILPFWFKRPNPVIFVPCDFAACALFLLYVNLVTEGGWFLTLALPVSLVAALIACTLATLLRYLRGGKLYVIGGSMMALGALVLMIELLMDYTFQMHFTGWSLYPFVTLFLVGGLVVYIAASRPLRERLEKVLFF